MKGWVLHGGCYGYGYGMQAAAAHPLHPSPMESLTTVPNMVLNNGEAGEGDPPHKLDGRCGGGHAYAMCYMTLAMDLFLMHQSPTKAMSQNVMVCMSQNVME